MTTSILLRAVKGSTLTWTEVDTNFTNLKNTADSAAANATSALGSALNFASPTLVWSGLSLNLDISAYGVGFYIAINMVSGMHFVVVSSLSNGVPQDTGAGSCIVTAGGITSSGGAFTSVYKL